MPRKWYGMPKESVSPDDEIDLSESLTVIIENIVHFSPTFKHIDVNRIIVCIGSNKTGGRGGIYGKLVPLKFADGSNYLKYRGTCYAIPEISKNGTTCLYIIYFYMPKFFDLPWDEKLRVIFHELFHISPHFNGDIRKMGNVKTAHGHSRKGFESLYKDELNNYLLYIQTSPHMGFLKMDTKSLFSRFKRVNGIRMKNPSPVIVK
jgi:hypothetical protein